MDNIDEWCSGLNSNISVQKQEYGLMVSGKIEDMADPNKFLSDEIVLQLLFVNNNQCI